MLAKVFKAYDVRATYPKPLNERIAWQVGYATAQFLLKSAADEGFVDPMSRAICVGRDMRQSSPSLSEQLRQGMRDAGATVIDLGLVDTPFVYFAINHLGCAGGVQVTASHNPSNYNGFKISKRLAKPVGQSTGLAEIQHLAALVESEKIEPKHGLADARDLWDAYRTHLRSFIDPRVLSGERTLRIAVDASNGMAGTMLPKVFDGIKGLVIEKLYFDNSSGEFVHEPNPLVESNLRDLQAVMAKGGFDAGFCFDGDADRCIVLDEKGAPIGCDLLLAWMCQDALAKKPGAAVIYDLRSSRSVSEIIREHGGFASPIETDPRLAEISLGEWDGMLKDDIRQRVPDYDAGPNRWSWFFNAPGGDSWDALNTRLQSWLADAAAANHPIIAISHGVSGRILRGLFAQLPRDQTLMLDIPQDACFHLRDGRIERVDC